MHSVAILISPDRTIPNSSPSTFILSLSLERYGLIIRAITVAGADSNIIEVTAFILLPLEQLRRILQSNGKKE